jgi:PHD/YefM family antitoxin component YafN of YafNO toxin-antitoxin module
MREQRQILVAGDNGRSTILHDADYTSDATRSSVVAGELARHASSIINDIEQNKEPTLVTRRGRPVVYMLPVDSEEFEDFVLTHAPQFVDGMAAADVELATGETVSLAEVRAELETDEPPSSHP